MKGKVTTRTPKMQYGGSSKTLLSLFDFSGAWAKPFEDAGWIVHQWDIKLSEFMDINLIEDADTALELFEDVNGIIAAPPCTDFSASGAHAWKFKDEDGRTHKSVELVRQVLRLVDLFSPTDPEYDDTFFWAIENPVGRMGKLLEMGEPWYFQPNEFAGWLKPNKAQINELNRIRNKSLSEKITRQEGDFVMKMEAYTKKTGIWGSFGKPEKKPLDPVYITAATGERFSPVAWFTGGKSAKTKELRSNTPLGFAMAFFEANKDFRAQFEPGYWEAQGWSVAESKKIYADFNKRSEPEPGRQKKLFRAGGELSVLKSNEAFEIIDSDEDLSGSDWTAGACYPLALALNEIYGGELVVIKADARVQHVMVKIGDKYLDADGLQDEETKLKNFELDSNRLKNKWNNPVIAEYKPEECSGLGKGSKETIEKIKQLILRNKKANGGPLTDEYNFRLIDKMQLPNIPSASAIEYLNTTDKLYIAGDDSPNLLIVDTDLKNPKYVRLFPGEGRIPKFEKHDIEASAIIKGTDGEFKLLLISSASLPGREIVIDIPVSDPEKFVVHSTQKFMNRVREKLNGAVNIEGMTAVVGFCVVLACRGNKKDPQNYLIATNTNFYTNQEEASIYPIKFKLAPDQGISGLCYIPKLDTLLFTVSTEHSVDAVSDGEIGDSHIGWVYDFSHKVHESEIEPSKLYNLCESSGLFKGEKIESICVEKYDDRGRCVIHMVSDNDNGTSNIFKAIIKIKDDEVVDFSRDMEETENGVVTLYPGAFNVGSNPKIKYIWPYIPKYSLQRWIDDNHVDIKYAEGGQLELFESQQIVTPEETRTIAEIVKDQRESEPEPQLTLLSFGGGQDSFAILYSLIYNKEFRKKYAPHDLVVAMSDTGNEFPYTYKAVKDAQALCKQHGIEFVFITPDMGYHTPGWQDLKANLRRNKVILGAAMGSKACTISLKINVVDKFMHHHMCALYGFEEKINKQSWEFYHKKFGTKARVLIGFAKNEEVRVVRSNKMHQFLPNWKRKNIQYVYPLVEEGWDRAIAQQIIGKYRKDIPPPSNCMICFYQSDQEILWLYRNYPAEFADWVELEKAKLDRFEGKVAKNYGVYGALNLTQKLEQAQIKYGHMTNEELWEYKMSHGHCIKSTY